MVQYLHFRILEFPLILYHNINLAGYGYVSKSPISVGLAYTNLLGKTMAGNSSFSGYCGTMLQVG